MTAPTTLHIADRIHGPDARQLRIDCDARLQNLGPLLDLLDAHACSARVAPELRHDLRLIVEEACMNIIQHAYRGSRRQGRLSLVWESLQHLGRPAISITLEDDGPPFAPLTGESRVSRPAAASAAEGGWGVTLIQQLSDVHCYRRGADGGNSLQLIKYLEPLWTPCGGAVGTRNSREGGR